MVHSIACGRGGSLLCSSLVFLWEHCCVASGLVLGYEDFLFLSAGQLDGSADEIVVVRLSLENLSGLDNEVCEVRDVDGWL